MFIAYFKSKKRNMFEMLRHLREQIYSHGSVNYI